ncbi:hypothetical protein [Nocardia sp. NPDC057227]|uniref:hypothetical protein n=1 Tax=Nocardia sp. NPDC057227 TaxID=3346056 RepID=UPI003638D3F6
MTTDRDTTAGWSEVPLGRSIAVGGAQLGFDECPDSGHEVDTHNRFSGIRMPVRRARLHHPHGLDHAKQHQSDRHRRARHFGDHGIGGTRSGIGRRLAGDPRESVPSANP